MRSFARMFVASLTMLRRDQHTIFIALAFPLVFVFAFRLFHMELTGDDASTLAVGDGGAGSVAYFDFALPGVLAMGVMQYALFGIAVALPRFREQQILKRMLATPLRPAGFIGAQVLARLVVIVVQVAVVLLVGALLGADALPVIPWMVLLAIPGSLIFLNLGFVLAGRAPNADSATGVANLLVLPLIFLCGVFFPLGSFPEFLQQAVVYLPLTPMVQSMRDVLLGSVDASAMGLYVAVMGGWIVITFLLAVRSFRFSQP